MWSFIQAMQLMSAIVHSVQAAESMLPQSSGADKLKAATDCVVGKVAAAQAVVPHIEAIVSSMVSIFNATGLFKKNAPPAGNDV